MSNNPDTFATQICATLTPPPPPSLAPRIAHDMRTQIQAHLRAAQEGDDPPTLPRPAMLLSLGYECSGITGELTRVDGW